MNNAQFIPLSIIYIHFLISFQLFFLYRRKSLQKKILEFIIMLYFDIVYLLVISFFRTLIEPDLMIDKQTS